MLGVWCVAMPWAGLTQRDFVRASVLADGSAGLVLVRKVQ